MRLAGGAGCATGRRWFGVEGSPSPARAIASLTHTAIGKESAASPHFAALLPCAALHAAPPQLLLISVWRMLLRAGQQRLVADARRWRQARRLGQSGWLTVHPGWCWVCGVVVGRRFSVAPFACACRWQSDQWQYVVVPSTLRTDRPRCGTSTSLIRALYSPA